jgi:hypothetical protein
LRFRRAGNAELPVAVENAWGERLFAHSRVCRSAQYNVTAKMPKAAAIAATTIISVGMVVSLASQGAMVSQVPAKDFDPDQIAIVNGLPSPGH